MNTITDDPSKSLTARIFHVLCCVGDINGELFGRCCAGCTERVISMHNVAKSVASEIQQIKRDTVHEDAQAASAQCAKGNDD